MLNEFTVLGRNFWISASTGTVKSVRQWSETSVEGGGGGGGVIYEGTGAVFGPRGVTSSTVGHCEFFISDGKSEERFKIVGIEKGLRESHEVTVAWVGRAGVSQGRVALIHNHTTGEREYLMPAINVTFKEPLKILGAGLLDTWIYLVWFIPFGLFFAIPITALLSELAWPFAVVGFFAAYLGPPCAYRRIRAKRKAAWQAAMIAAIDAAV